MTETTTPEAPNTEAPVAPIEQPVEPTGQEQPAAVAPTTEPTPTTQATDEPAIPADNSEDDLSDYWSKKGIDITTPEGQAQAAKSYREAEQNMHKKSQEASELTKQLTSQPVDVESENEVVQSLANEVTHMKRTQAVSSFVAEVNLTAEQEKGLSAYLQANPTKIALINAGHMTLNEAYQLSGVGAQDAEKLRKEGGQAALETLADKQRASAAQGSASVPSPTQQVTAENVDQWYANLTPEERAKPETQKVLSSLMK